MAPESALLFVIMSPVSAYYKAREDGAVSIYADPAVVRAFPGGVGNRKVGSNYGPTIGESYPTSHQLFSNYYRRKIRWGEFGAM